MQKLSRWGVGPSILVWALVYVAVAGAATWAWPDACLVGIVPYRALLTLAVALLGIGIPMLAVAGRAAMAAYNSDRLATTGIFGLVRNPIYSAWIVFIIPGLVLLGRSWPLLFTPLVAYAVFKTRIGRENAYLDQRFGEAYRKYRDQVNEIMPFPRRK